MTMPKLLRKIPGNIFVMTITILHKIIGVNAAREFAKGTLHFAYGVLGVAGDAMVLALERRIPRSVCNAKSVEVVRHGVRHTLYLDDNAQRVMYFTGWYERQFTEWLLSELRKDDVYLDIGAHVGMHAATAARRLSDLGGGKVIAIEAAEDSAAKIRKTIEVNGLSNIEVVQIGLGDHEGMLELRTDERYPSNDAGVRSQFNRGQLVCEVRLVRLDDIAESIGLTKADIVKLDIEGGELATLKGMLVTLRRLKPRFVAVEVEETRLRQSKTSDTDLNAVLAACGYEPTGTAFLTNVFYKRAA